MVPRLVFLSLVYTENHRFHHIFGRERVRDITNMGAGSHKAAVCSNIHLLSDNLGHVHGLIDVN